MIEAKNLSKSFDNIKALDNINASIRDGDVFGLIGTNGAGKSTFLKVLAGILKPDSGEILIDDENVFENIKAKEKFFYISDDQFFFSNTFDGLDPVMRQAVKSLFAKEMDERGLTPIIASHNLRELEDICDHVGLLHKGGILLSKDVSDMKLNIHKVQCVFEKDFDMERLKELDIMQVKNSGRVHTITIKGSEEDIREKMESFSPVFYEMMGLSLEEIFISETEVYGYDIKKLIF